MPAVTTAHGCALAIGTSWESALTQDGSSAEAVPVLLDLLDLLDSLSQHPHSHDEQHSRRRAHPLAVAPSSAPSPPSR